MWIFCLLGIVIGLVINYFVAKEIAEIAEMKGFFGITYFWFTFFLGIVGILMVIALPDASQNKVPQPSMAVPTASPSAQSRTSSATQGGVHFAGASEWTCTCGRNHKDYESSCVCGVTKIEAKAAQNK